MQLNRLTTRYVEEEDRIRVSGESAAGDRIAFWLSRRLLVRFLPHLFAWVERAEGVRPTGDAPRDRVADLRSSFAQQASRAELDAAPPPPVDAQGEGWLVGAVDITEGNSELVIAFRGAAAGQRAVISTPPKVLRQWLGILCDQFRAAEWPLDVWPAWIYDGRGAESPPVSLH